MLQHYAKKFIDDISFAAENILKSTYMDDSMESVLDEEDGQELHWQLFRLLSKAGIHAQKYVFFFFVR